MGERPITNPFIRDTITIDAAFNAHVSSFTGGGTLYLLARVVEQQVDLSIGARSVVIVADELRGNNHLIDASGFGAGPGSHGKHADPTPPGQFADHGDDGGTGGTGGAGGHVTVMCRRSSGVRITVSGGAGGNGGNGGNGGRGSNGTVIPGATVETGEFDELGNPITETLPDVEIPGTLGGGGGLGGHGGAGGDAGTITFTTIVDDPPPQFEAVPGTGGAGGAGGIAGPPGLLAEIPEDLDTSPVAGDTGATGALGSVTHVVVAEEEYPAGLRPLLDADGRDFANRWAPYRIVVGQYFYRQHRRSDPIKGLQADTEFARTLELQPDNADALRWRSQLSTFPRPLSTTTQEAAAWQPGGLNALGLPRDLDVLPRFDDFSDAVGLFGGIVLQFLTTGIAVLVDAQQTDTWRVHLAAQRGLAVAAQQSTIEDRGQAETEVRLASDALAGVQRRLEETTADIQAALVAMQEERMDILGVVGTIAGVAAAVVAVVAAMPSLGTSLVALAPAMVALSSSVIDNLEPNARALLAGEELKTKEIKEAYKKVDGAAADVVKGAKAIVSFVEVVQKLTAASTQDTSTHKALVRRGMELTHELLLARRRVTLAEQRLQTSHARVARAEDAVRGIDAVDAALTASREALRATGLHAVAIAESRADALLTLAFYAQRSMEIYTWTDQEDKVKLETGRLHPDRVRDYDEGLILETKLVELLTSSWDGFNGLLDMQVAFERFVSQMHDSDTRRLSFRPGHPAFETLRSTHRLPFRVDAASLPPEHADAKVRGVRVALVGATHPTGSQVTCQVRHGSAYEMRRHGGSVDVMVLQPGASHRHAKLEQLAATELGADSLLTDPQSLAFWGRGIGGEWELTIPRHEVESGLDLTGLTEVQVWITYQFLP